MIDFFIEIVLSVVIFSKMGSGKDSGKLLFKKIFSDNAFSIEDDGISITFSSSGSGGASITKDQVAYGTGTGITSDQSFRVCNDTYKESIFGFYSVRNNPSTSIASYVQPSTKNAFIIGGATNSIVGAAKNSVIIGGCGNRNNSGAVSNVIGGVFNEVSGTINNTILSGEFNLSTGDNNLILSGRLNKSYNNNNCSGIISSSGSCLDPNGLNVNSFNIISSSLKSCTINFGYVEGETICGSFLASTGFSKIILTPTFSSYDSVYKFNQESRPPFSGAAVIPEVLKNTILSSYKSVTNNICQLDGGTKYNNHISSNYTRSDGITHNILSTKCSIAYSTKWTGRVSSKNYMNIIASECSCSNDNYSNLISTECSIVGRTYDSIIGGECNQIDYLSSGYSSIVGGEKNRIRGDRSVSIIGGASNSIDGQGLLVGGCFNYSRGRSVILGGGKNYNYSSGNDALLIGGYCNQSLISSVILGGSKISTGFSRCSSYGSYAVGEMVSSGSFRGISCNDDCVIVIGGTSSRMTLSCGSVIISGQKNCIVNSKNSIIIGGVDNQIQAHGIFGTISENWFVLGQSYDNVPPLPPFNSPGYLFDPVPLTNRPYNCYPANAYQPSYGISQYNIGYVKNSFIIGGCCNIFGSCIEKNYCSTYFNVGLTTSKSHYVYNSGIIGGFKNQIYNKSKILTESWNSGNNPNNCLVNSVIIGGSNIKLSKSNAFATGELIITGSNSAVSRVIINNPSNPGIQQGLLSGVFSNPAGILVCEGFVIQVY